MDKQNKHSINHLEKYLKYFRDLFSVKEQHDFEKKIMKDRFEEEAFDGLSQISAEQITEDITELQQRIQKRVHSSRTLFIKSYLRYAAAAILIISVGITVIVVRKSSKTTLNIAEQNIEKDTSQKKETTFKSGTDTLKNNIAYIPSAEKQPISKEKEKYDLKSRISETDVEQHEVSDEMITVTATSGGIITGQESEEIVEDKQEMLYEAEVVDLDEKIRSKASKKGFPESMKKYAQEEKSGFTEPSEVKSEEGIITGRVISSTDESPLQGVNITFKGTATGTISDVDGNFQLQIPAVDSPVLQFAYVGYNSEELEVGDYKDVTVALSEDLVALEEVVVVGYGTTRSSDVRGAASTIEINEEAPYSPVSIPPEPIGG